VLVDLDSHLGFDSSTQSLTAIRGLDRFACLLALADRLLQGGPEDQENIEDLSNDVS
jgi:hypothetical protein